MTSSPTSTNDSALSSSVVESTPTLSTSGLSFAYASQPILDGIDLQLEGGSMVGLIGPNGAGKSTLLRILLGLIKPDSGSVLLQGKALSQMTRRDLARLMALVPQDSRIDYAFSVEEVVAMGRNPWLDRFQPAGSEDIEIIERAMQQTDVLQFAKRPVDQLSGGERQRVLIARAIAQQTPIIMLDEATANLDICHQLEIMELARELASEGRLVVAAIHDLNMASRFCDRLLLLAERQLQADGMAAEVISETNLRRFFNLQAEVRVTQDAGQTPTLSVTAIGSAKFNNAAASSVSAQPKQ